MRERFESGAARRTPRVLAVVLLVLVGAWIASASLLDKRWHEVVLDVLPYLIVGVALVRTPHSMHKIGQRMKEYERAAGEDPDEPSEEGDAGPSTAIL